MRRCLRGQFIYLREQVVLRETGHLGMEGTRKQNEDCKEAMAHGQKVSHTDPA